MVDFLANGQPADIDFCNMAPVVGLFQSPSPAIYTYVTGVKSIYQILMSRGSVVVSKHGLYVGSPGSIPTAITTMTAAGGDAEHVSLNH